MKSKESKFQSWSCKEFVNVHMEENWGEHELSEPSYVLIENDWYPDKDLSAKWNHQLPQAGVKITENEPCSDIHLSMVSEPKFVMAVDQQGKSTPMASGIMVVKDIQGRHCSRLLKVLFDSGGSKSMCH